jgi:ATP-dependent Clp protease protease subunit
MARKEESRSAGDPFQSKIAERLLDARTILIVGEITSKLAQQITAQLLAMAAISDADITIFIHSEGGHVESEDRFCLPNTRFLIHQPQGGMGGQAADIRIEAEEMLKTRERLNRTLADATGQPLEKVQEDTERNHWMSPEEAREYGIVGAIISSSEEL